MDKNLISSVKKKSFIDRVSSFFGFRKTIKKDGPMQAKLGIEPVQVDLEDLNNRGTDKSAFVTSDQVMSDKLNKLLDAYLSETGLSYSDVRDRTERIQKLQYMYCNDTFIKRCVDLVADECTQIDQQDRILTIESDNRAFVCACYQLFIKWGLTQSRLRDIAKDLERYGEAFWVHPVDENGIKFIKPLDPASVKERLEFCGSEVSKHLGQMMGQEMSTSTNRIHKISNIISQLENESYNDLAGMLDSKLFGYELVGQTFCPAWSITHFRLESEEFYPYGRPPLLECFSAFDQCYTSYALQALARSQSFPLTVFNVEVPKAGGPGKMVEYVDSVRQRYLNLGVSVGSESSEPFTLNTSMWMPKGLIEVQKHDAKVDYNFTDDLQLLENRVAFGCGIPKSYLDGTYNGFGASGVSLIQQYKPFARHVYSIQTAILQGIGEMIRLHFAITREFDPSVRFLVKMHFPAQEMDDAARARQSASLDLAAATLDAIKTALGLTDDDQIPVEVARDIYAKYSFIDNVDLDKWMKSVELNRPEENVEESKKSKASKLKEQRLKETRALYENVKESIYLNVLQENAIVDFSNSREACHSYLVGQIDESSPLSAMFEALSGASIEQRHSLREASEVVRLKDNFHVPAGLGKDIENFYSGDDSEE